VHLVRVALHLHPTLEVSLEEVMDGSQGMCSKSSPVIRILRLRFTTSAAFNTGGDDDCPLMKADPYGLSLLLG